MKHTKASCGHMFAHYDRKAEHISNENLDRSRTHLNYNLATHQQEQQGEFIRKRCSEVKCFNRQDVNVMCSWVLTAPKDLPKKDTLLFFQQSYNFMAERYGKENVVSAYVHHDEVSPHMHFAFVPVVEDKKKGGYKVSAKELITRKDLQTFHFDLEHHLNKALGYEVGVMNEATREGNKTVAELKQQTAIRKTKELEGKLEKTEIAVNATESRLESLQGILMELSEVQAIEGKKSFTGALKNVPYEKFISLQKTAKINAEYVEELKATVTGLNGKIESLQTELLKKDNDLIENKMELKVIEKYSDINDDIIGILKFKAQTSMDEEFKNILDFYRKGITYIEKIKTKPVEEKAIENMKNKYQSQGKNLIFFKKEKDGTQTAMIPKVLEEEFEKALKTVKDNLLKQKKEIQSFSQGFSR